MCVIRSGKGGDPAQLLKTSIRFERDPSLDHVDIIFRAPEQDDSVLKLMETLSNYSSDSFEIVDEKGNIRKILQDEIISVSVSGKIVKFITENGKWSTRQTLQSIEALLDEQHFIRISRYEIINLDKVLRYDFTVAGILRIELAGGIETWASRRSIPLIRRKLAGKG